jgi:hypothetical protein
MELIVGRERKRKSSMNKQTAFVTNGVKRKTRFCELIAIWYIYENFQCRIGWSRVRSPKWFFD